MDMHQVLWKVHPILRPHVFEQTVHHGLHHARHVLWCHHAGQHFLPRLFIMPSGLNPPPCPDCDSPLALMSWSFGPLLVSWCMTRLVLPPLWIFSLDFFGPQHRVARAPGHGYANCLIGLAIAGLEFLEHAGAHFVRNAQPARSAAPGQIR